MKPFLTTILLLVLVWGTVGCGSEDASIYMAEARSTHQRVQRALDADDAETATEELEALIDTPVPQSVNPDDARVVRQDVFFRLAEIALEQRNATVARDWADRGLNEGLAEDVFTANLYVVRGTAREAIGEDIQAAADYHEALLINDALLQRLLGAGDDE